MTEQETKLIPVVDVTRVILASLAFAGTATFVIARLLSRRRK